jgi:hypothetical protein
MEGTHQNKDNSLEVKTASAGVDAHAFFAQNSHFASIYKKTEKLVTALYMITNFIKDNEPLKWQIRDNGISLMSLNISFSTVSLSERKELLNEFHALALEIVSLARVAHHAGLVSEMNFTILAREFGNLVSMLDKAENKEANEQTVILDPGFFDMPTAALPTQTEAIAPVAPQEISKGHFSRTSIPAKSTPSISHKPEYLPLKDLRDQAEKKDDKNSRQAAITKLLSKKSGLSIKDFAASISGVSEKTIQRELLAMVASGVLKKEGERRWSTYSLA